jgi:hypothetical protein
MAPGLVESTSVLGIGNQGGQCILFSVGFTPPPHTRQYLAHTSLSSLYS